MHVLCPTSGKPIIPDASMLLMPKVTRITRLCHIVSGSNTAESRSEFLSLANKRSRTYTMLLESLNRHRGKGQQKMTVENVHVHAGGQAIVGNVGPEAGGAVHVR